MMRIHFKKNLPINFKNWKMNTRLSSKIMAGKFKNYGSNWRKTLLTVNDRPSDLFDKSVNADSDNVKGRLQIGKLYLIHQYYKPASLSSLNFKKLMRKTRKSWRKLATPIGQEEYPRQSLPMRQP